MGRRARALMLLAGIGAALAACNLLTGLDADFKVGMDAAVIPGEGGPDGDGPDGDKPDGSMTDAPSDGPGVDAGRFCNTVDPGPVPADFFCNDFEDGEINIDAGTATGWTAVRNVVNGGTGTIQLTAGVGKNGTRGLDVSSMATTTVGRQTRLYKMLGSSTQANEYLAYELDYDFRVDASALGYEAFGLLVFTPNVRAEQHGIAGYGPDTPHQLSRPALDSFPPVTKKHPNEMKWMHARVTLTHAAPGTPFTRTITIDGNDVDGATNGNYTIPMNAPTEVTVGVFNSNDTGFARAQFDNVVFRRRP